MTSDAIQVVGIVTNAALLILGGLIGLFLKGMSATLKDTTDKITENSRAVHSMEIEFAKMQASVSSIEGLRRGQHDLRNEIHTMQLRMAEKEALAAKKNED